MPADAAGAIPAVVLFDLDGTLADTFPDLEWALSRALAEQGLAPGLRSAVRARVSAGARAMTVAALAGRPADVDRLHARFLELYAAGVAARTVLFEGMHAVLDALDAHGIGVGVVTNKRTRFTEPLIDALGLRPRLRSVVSGDSAARAKPYPDPLLMAAGEAGAEPGECVYVGDARNDVLAARAAAMPVAVATYGYLGPDDDPSTWAADALLPAPCALLDWLRLAR